MCHCSNRRALTGSAFLPPARIEREELTVTRGAESSLVDGDPEAAYELRVRAAYSLLTGLRRDDYFGVPHGTLIHEPTLKPTHHSPSGSKAPWYEFMTTPPHHERPPSRTGLTPGSPFSGVISEHWRRSGMCRLGCETPVLDRSAA